ncbi:MAG: hypothetical protein J6X33_03875 [Clostridiales bacterium]|nr:hypothetical protein [Clostridiales bacterium]
MNTVIVKRIAASAFAIAILCGNFGSALLNSGTVNSDTIVVPIDKRI